MLNRNFMRWLYTLLAAVAVTAACAPPPTQTAPAQRDGRQDTAQGSQGKRFTGKVVRVVDGDTLHILRGREDVKVRLKGIDAPERGQPFGGVSKRWLNKAANQKQATIIVHGIDQDCRTLGTVMVDGVDLNRKSVEEGMAWRYKYSDDKALGKSEATARKEHRGLWRDANPIQPWQWRHMSKQERARAVSGRQERREDGKPAKEATNGRAAATGTYWPNTNSDVRRNECKRCGV